MELPYDPTPAEIARMCEEIREGWSDDEERRRRRGLEPGRRHALGRGDERYVIPTVSVDVDVALALNVAG